MNEDKVYTPTVISDTPFIVDPTAVSYNSSQTTTGGATAPSTISNQPPPIPRAAVEVIGSSLNTKSRKILAEFQFTPSGSIQIGEYTNGISGDIRISPNGIVARNQSGDITFNLDGDSGDAVFKGSVQAGSIITGQVVVGDNRIVLDGDAIQIVFNDGTNDRCIIGLIDE